MRPGEENNIVFHTENKSPSQTIHMESRRFDYAGTLQPIPYDYRNGFNGLKKRETNCRGGKGIG